MKTKWKRQINFLTRLRLIGDLFSRSSFPTEWNSRASCDDRICFPLLLNSERLSLFCSTQVLEFQSTLYLCFLILLCQEWSNWIFWSWYVKSQGLRRGSFMLIKLVLVRKYFPYHRRCEAGGVFKAKKQSKFQGCGQRGVSRESKTSDLGFSSKESTHAE